MLFFFSKNEVLKLDLRFRPPSKTPLFKSFSLGFRWTPYNIWPLNALTLLKQNIWFFFYRTYIVGGSAILKYHFCIALHMWQMCCIKGRNTPIFEPTCVLLLFQNHILTFWEAALLTTSLKSAVVLNCHSEQLCSFPMLKAHNCQSQMKIKHQQYCG